MQRLLSHWLRQCLGLNERASKSKLISDSAFPGLFAPSLLGLSPAWQGLSGESITVLMSLCIYHTQFKHYLLRWLFYVEVSGALWSYCGYFRLVKCHSLILTDGTTKFRKLLVWMWGWGQYMNSRCVCYAANYVHRVYHTLRQALEFYIREIFEVFCYIIHTHRKRPASKIKWKKALTINLILWFCMIEKNPLTNDIKILNAFLFPVLDLIHWKQQFQNSC